MSTPPTERDFEVALESAAQSVQSGASLRSRNIDPLAAEYEQIKRRWLEAHTGNEPERRPW